MTSQEAFDELRAMLREADAKPYINTLYLSPEGRARAFRARSRAFLTGTRVAVRHFVRGEAR